jgi:hypothetical protein
MNMNKKEKELAKRSILHEAGILTGDDWKTVELPSYLNVDRILDYIQCISDVTQSLAERSLINE